jgi:hypothetical protein
LNYSALAIVFLLMWLRDRGDRIKEQERSGDAVESCGPATLP